MAGRPNGTVTFLFSDVEGSWRLVGVLGPVRYRVSVEYHRGIIRSAVARLEGHEVDSQGD
jgi:class 3 adenylate cyclase